MSLIKIPKHRGESLFEDELKEIGKMSEISGDNIIFKNIKGVVEQNGEHFLNIEDFDDEKYDVDKTIVCVTPKTHNDITYLSVHLHLKEK